MLSSLLQLLLWNTSVDSTKVETKSAEVSGLSVPAEVEASHISDESDVVRNPYPSIPAWALEQLGKPVVIEDDFIKPSAGVVTSRFRTANRPNHQGIDIASQIGSPIWASADGVVEVPTYDANGYGNWVVVIHSGGLETYYGHLSKINVKTGDKVKQGTVIGLEGSSGRSSAAHVHQSFVLNGVSQDPEDYYNAE